eukprot:tig00001331_g8169.t1
MPLRVGEQCPSGWVLQDQLGGLVNFDRLIRRQPYVMIFFPPLKGSRKDIVNDAAVNRSGQLYQNSAQRHSSGFADLGTTAEGSKSGRVMAKQFAKHYEAFKQAGAEVIGIVADSPANIQEFANAEQIPFAILCDSRWEVSRKFKADPSFGWFGKKITYVVGPDGLIHMAKESASSDSSETASKFNEHVAKALQKCQQFQGGFVPPPVGSPSPVDRSYISPQGPVPYVSRPQQTGFLASCLPCISCCEPDLPPPKPIVIGQYAAGPSPVPGRY